MSNIPQSIAESGNDYVKKRNAVEKLEKQLETVKKKLLYAEQVFVENCGQHGIKNYKHAEGTITLARNVFGSIKKDYEKEDVLEGIKHLDKFKDLIVTKEDFNSKHLGSRVRDMEAAARELWIEKNAAAKKPKPFTPELYLPKFLIEVLNLSEGFNVRFTRTKTK